IYSSEIKTIKIGKNSTNYLWGSPYFSLNFYWCHQLFLATLPIKWMPLDEASLYYILVWKIISPIYG
ncbi:MAG: hypothetical protein IIW47_01240, partial [Bacteroidales bacterium]|nr:hypothetical protein [Bacteroidales bacterium]